MRGGSGGCGVSLVSNVLDIGIKCHFLHLSIIELVKRGLLGSSCLEGVYNKIIPFIFLFLVEIFPLKSTGSFFTTGNSTYLFLIMGILVGLLPKNNSIENKV